MMAPPVLVGRQLWTSSNQQQQQQQVEQQHESIPSAEEVTMDGSTGSAGASASLDISIVDENSGDNTSPTNTETLVPHLRNLEEERENRRRRTSTCILIATFFLFRLWVEALASSDSSLLLVAILLTSWTFRWVQSNRETEDEIDRAIQEYIQRADE